MSAALRPYPGYKDSGLPWLGAIPKAWRQLPVRAITRTTNKRGQPELPLLSVYREYGVIDRSSRDDNHNPEGADLSTYKVVSPGDLVLNKMKTWQGSLGISQFNGIVSPAYIVCRVAGDINGKFLHYQLRSRSYIDEYNRISFGVRVNQWDMRYEDFKKINVLLPPPAEQAAIVAFLDAFDRRINRLIRAKRRLIALLGEEKQAIIQQAVTRGLDPHAPLKPSGVDWLGDVPAHWELIKLKHVALVQTGITLGKNYGTVELETHPYLRVANVQAGYLDLRDVATISVPSSEVSTSTLAPGDVLMTEGGDPDKLGRGCLWQGEIAGCLHQNHIFAVRPVQRRLLPEFLVLLMASSHGRIYFQLTAKQTTNLASTNSTTLKKFLLPLPSIKEQRAILDRVACESEGPNAAIAAANAQIRLLQEYRARLIADVVTGKLDVRGVALPVLGEDEPAEPFAAGEDAAIDEAEGDEEPGDADD